MLAISSNKFPKETQENRATSAQADGGGPGEEQLAIRPKLMAATNTTANTAVFFIIIWLKHARAFILC